MLLNARNDYDDINKVEDSLKKVFKRTKELTVLGGHVNIEVMYILESSATHLLRDSQNNRYDNLVKDIKTLQDLFDKVPAKLDSDKEFVSKTKFVIIKNKEAPSNDPKILFKIVFPFATRPASTRQTEALKSVAIISAP